MCGIAGRISWTDIADRAALELMAARMAHRGPDAEGIWAEGPAALVHRRLSVIDLDPRSHQPMLDAEAGLALVYNGEIYNFRELRQELSAAGARFRTSGDTEVVIEAYKRWGTDCLERLRGQFAFGLWDARRQQVFLARDRLGEKPLFHAALPGGGIAFASEIRTLVSDPAVSREIDPEGLAQYLAHNYVLAPATLLRGVRSLPAAHAMVVSRGRPARTWRYWDVAPHFARKRQFASLDAAADELAQRIDAAVRSQMIADVPLGAFLSGGVDSGTVAAAMARATPPERVLTFSIDFAEPGYGEAADARATAAHLGTTHADRMVAADPGRLADLLWAADQPLGDSSFLPTHALAAMTRERVTVALSGDGGDELFAGYPTYLADRLHRALDVLPAGLLRAAGSAWSALVPASRGKVSFDYRLRRFLACQGAPWQDAHVGWRMIFDADERLALLAPHMRREVATVDPLAPFRSHFADVQDCDPLDQALYVDTKTWLADDILVKVDRAAMANSLESRAPFLDSDLVEFAASLPAELKLAGTAGKRVLKRSQRARLPRAVLDRRKRGFNAPVAHWTAALGDLLQGDVAQGMIDSAAVSELRAEHDARRRDNSHRLYGLASLHVWLGRLRAAPAAAPSGRPAVAGAA